jgi:hypothetical protein
LALARPAITVSLLIGGGMMADEVLHQAATQAVTHTVTQLGTDVAIGGGVAAAGETIVGAVSQPTLQQGVSLLLGRIDREFAKRRRDWLVGLVERDLLGELLAEMHQGAELVDGPAMRTLRNALARLGPVARTEH